ncbi:Maintenance of ploidy protein mob2 [Ceratobasidium sp. 370]|nr:Maintenance of ploidy protein mob2 [Ceratobasidium sp. 370]
MSFFNSIGRMGRNPTRGGPPKRSPSQGPAQTPTSATFYDPAAPPLPTPTTPAASKQPPLYMCQPFVKAALVKGNFKTIVMLPKYTDVNEWVAVNSPALDYTWVDQSRKAIKLPAPTYIDYVMTWLQNMLDDESVFPTKAGREFPATFASVAKHIYRQLLRVFAHIYHAHYPALLHLSSEGHFNSLFAHFLAFGKQYDLLELKDIKSPGSGTTGGGLPGIGDLWEKWKEMGILEA